MTSVPICVGCKRYRGELTCEAFPDRIPDLIIENQIDHRQPVYGDKGLQFVAKNRKATARAEAIFDA
jgi:hypothetical protein